MHQQNGFIPVDPEAVAYHNQRQGGNGIGVPSSLGLYGISGGGEYQSRSGIEEVVEGGEAMSDVRVSVGASVIVAAAGVEGNQDSLCGVLRHQSSRGARASSQHHRMYSEFTFLCLSTCIYS